MMIARRRARGDASSTRSGGVQLLLQLVRAIVHARLELGLAPLAQRAPRVLRGRVGGLLGCLDLIDHGGRRGAA